MKPEIYYENKNMQIQNLAQFINFQIPRAAANTPKGMDALRTQALNFISLTPDETDAWTDFNWVNQWKTIYNRLGSAIQDIKATGDYRLDNRRKELSAIATALLAARKSVYWIK